MATVSKALVAITMGLFSLLALNFPMLNWVNSPKKFKALELGFSPAQIRVIIMTDSKACTKLLKAENGDAIKAILVLPLSV